ncbi:uncharacterized protein LOC123264994 [Cotesia glomerata]|uniref:uncharacterized protein LOC123264994 n=1 Tax=Cotesia glomerata TaxID=32391 RepID=UPI001D032221|nr:uncharacterized protein LOC123264994 [Cotesia glomerata]
MSLLNDICFRCKSAFRTPYTCDTCNKSFHKSCMCGYIKSRQKGDCCRLKFAYLLELLDTNINNNKIRITNNIRVNSLRSVTSNNSSTSSFKSAKSTNSPAQRDGTKLKTSILSPSTPTGLPSPASDSVFFPESDNFSRDNLDRNSEGSISKEATPTLNSAMTSLSNGWSTMSTDDKLTSVLFDLTKAFDYVDHKVILRTLVELGFSIETITWFFSYLTNRSQSVVDKQGIPVGFVETTSGVPQGSVLGAILFLIVMNLVIKRLAYSRYGLFADDTYIYLHFYSYQLHEAIRLINVDAQAVADWARENGLEVNLKTKAMLLGSNNRVKSLIREGLPPIIIDSVTLPYTDSAKCLGLHLSSDLSWNFHVVKTVSKINSTLYSLKLRKNIYTANIKKLLVSATILPLIDYCIIVLTNSLYENDRKLQRSLNSAIRFIFHLKRDEHITPYRRELGWLSIKSRRIYYVACYFYKLLDIEKPCYLRDLFCKDLTVKHSERLAAKKNSSFKMPNFATTHYEYSFVVTVIRLWDELPVDIVNSSSLEIFKNKLFDYLFNLDI